MSNQQDENSAASGQSASNALLEREKPFEWEWMMNYCKLHGIPPAQEWA